MKYLTPILLIVPLASCSALGTALESTGRSITTLSDPTATEEEQAAAVVETTSVLTEVAELPGAESAAVTGLGLVLLNYWRNRNRRKRGEPVDPPVKNA